MLNYSSKQSSIRKFGRKRNQAGFPVAKDVEDPQLNDSQEISHTVFSNPPQDSPAQVERNKVSYWLKKLFDQRAQKVIDDKTSTLEPELKKSAEQRGRYEDAQTFSEEHAKDKRLTEEMVRKSNREVLSISTVFPWDLFPTTIRIQENKVSFIFHQFITSQEQDVDIKDISNTHIEQSFFFAKLKIISDIFANEPVTIEHLRKKDAIRARMYIQGLQLFNKKNIDTSDYEIEELIQKLEELQKYKYNESAKKDILPRVKYVENCYSQQFVSY